MDEAVAQGVRPILAVSMDALEAEAVLALRERHRGVVLAGVGLHPSRLVELTASQQEEQVRRIVDLAAEADFIGEIGLDYKDARDENQRDRQRNVLVVLLETAARYRLAVNLHTRRADREVVETAFRFRDRTGLGALIHWFTHSKKMTRLCAQRGVFVSVGPSILIDEAAGEVARSIEQAVVLVETDSPVAYGPLGESRPSWSARVLARLAELKGAPRESLEAAMERSVDDYLGRREAGA